MHPKRRLTARRIAQSVGIAALALAGCADPNGSQTDRHRSSKSERALVVSIAGGPTTLDPHLQDDAVSHSVLFNIYEGLTRFDEDMRVQPGLASSWENPDENTWRFELRRNALFHDLETVTAWDVEFSLKRALEHPDSLTSGYLVGVVEVRALNSFSVEIVLDRPNAPLLNKLAFVAIMPQIRLGEVTEPIGTGPYRFAGRTDDGGLKIEAFEEYRGGPPPVSTFVFERFRDLEQELDHLLSTSDIVLTVSFDEAARFRETGGWRLESVPSLSVSYLGLNSNRPPFDDLRVRQAIDLALDRIALADRSEGFADPAYQLVPRQVFGFDPDLPDRARDLEMARRLLADAGFENGIDFEIAAYHAAETDQIVAQLAEAGLRATVESQEWSDLIKIFTNGEFDVFLSGLICPTGDASDILDSELHTPDPSRGFGHFNNYGYSNPELDAEIERAGAELSPRLRGSSLRACLRIVTKDLPLVPLLVPHAVSAVRDGIEWSPRPDTFFRAWEVGRD